MIRINEHYLKLQDSYLFANIAKRVKAFQARHPQKKIIRLGIGDVTRALPTACIQALGQRRRVAVHAGVLPAGAPHASPRRPVRAVVPGDAGRQDWAVR